MYDMQLQIKSFNIATTMARKVEKDKAHFLDQLIKKKRSTDPADSSHYIHISKYNKLKDELIAEKCKSREIKKEMYTYENMVKSLKLTNSKTQEALKQFITQNKVAEVGSAESYKGNRRRNKSFVAKQASPVKSSEINNYYITKHLDSLYDKVKDFDVQKAVYDIGMENSMKKLRVKRVKIIKKIHQRKDVSDGSSDYSQEFEDIDAKANTRNIINLNTTLNASYEKDLNKKLELPPARKENHSTLRFSNRLRTPISNKSGIE